MSFWDLEDTTPPPSLLMTPAPTPTVAPTNLPAELVAQNVRAMPLLGTSQPPGLGQWNGAQFDSYSIGATPPPTPAAAPSAGHEYDGPPPTGKGVKDIVIALGLPPSLGTLVDDMQDAIVGITADLTGSDTTRSSLADIFTHNNRLRGIGSLLVIIAVVGLFLDSFGDATKTTTSSLANTVAQALSSTVK